MAKIKAKLRSMDLRGETVSTRWGNITFSREGLSELLVDEDQLDDLRALKWLVEGPGVTQDAPEAPPLPPEPDGPSAPVSPSGGGFDTSDAETPPQGTKASKSIPR